MVIVEIKTRSSYDTSFPEEAVTRKKQQFLKLAAAAFAEENRQYINIRYDIISVLVDGENLKEIAHFEEAFY